MARVEKKYKWLVLFHDCEEHEPLKGFEKDEATAIKKLFSLLEDKAFAESVRGAYVFSESKHDVTVSVHPLTRTVFRGYLLLN